MGRSRWVILVVSVMVGGCATLSTTQEGNRLDDDWLRERLDRKMAPSVWEEEGSSPEISLPLAVPHRIISPYGVARGRRVHYGVDLMPRAMGAAIFAPVLAVGEGEVVLVRDMEEFEGKGGRLLRGEGEVVRGKVAFPRTLTVEGYGLIHPFSRNYGPGRTGLWVVIAHREGPLEGMWSHYMHLGATRVSKGDHVRAGQEIGLVGATAVLRDRPHLHFALSRPGFRQRASKRFINPHALLRQAAPSAMVASGPAANRIP